MVGLYACEPAVSSGPFSPDLRVLVQNRMIADAKEARMVKLRRLFRLSRFRAARLLFLSARAKGVR